MSCKWGREFPAHSAFLAVDFGGSLVRIRPVAFGGSSRPPSDCPVPKRYRGVRSARGIGMLSFGCRRSQQSVCRPTPLSLGRCRGVTLPRSVVRIRCSVAFGSFGVGERFSASAFVYGLNPVAGETSRRKNIQSRFISPPSWWNCTLVCPPSTKSSILGK